MVLDACSSFRHPCLLAACHCITCKAATASQACLSGSWAVAVVVVPLSDYSLAEDLAQAVVAHCVARQNWLVVECVVGSWGLYELLDLLPAGACLFASAVGLNGGRSQWDTLLL